MKNTQFLDLSDKNLSINLALKLETNMAVDWNVEMNMVTLEKMRLSRAGATLPSKLHIRKVCLSHTMTKV